MFKRLLKILPVLLTVLLISVCFLFNGVQASDCAHQWSDWSGRDGQHRRECTECGSVVTAECEYYSILLRPTCTEKGHTEKTCMQCGDKIFTDETPARGHVWNEGTNILLPTCVDEGKTVYDCLFCDEQRQEVIAATGEHTITEDAAVAPTCKETGLTEGAHCSVCQEVFIEQKTIEKTAHDWDLQNTLVLREPTCLPGIVQTSCRNCDASEEHELAAVEAHKTVTYVQVDATCTEEGSTRRTVCLVCEMVLLESEVIPAKGHDWTLTVHTQVTCTTDGLCDRYCLSCKQEEKNVLIPAAGHSYTTIPAKPAACTEEGYTASRVCSACGDVLVTSAKIEPLGHAHALSATRAATCTADGKNEYTCIRCPDSYSETISRLGHDMYVASTTQPTCTAIGLILQRCTRCAHTISQSINARGHDEIYTVTPATCTEGGFTAVTCSRCDYAGTINPTEATGHNGEVIQTVAATCTADGYEIHRCTACGFEYQANSTPMKGHTWGPGTIIAPTCTEDGYTLFVCLFCPERKTQTPTAATGHSLYEAASNGNGTHSGYCTRCEQAATENCSGGTLSCVQAAQCTQCRGFYGTPTGEHSFTKYTVVSNSQHRLDCANCDTVGDTNENHYFLRGDFVVSASGFSYACLQCEHKVWGRPIGDADGNGIVADVADARTALRYSVGLDTPTDAAFSASDVDRDGEVTTADARKLLRVSVGLDEGNWSVLFVTEDGNLP